MATDARERERAALETVRLMLKLVSRHFSESGSALHDDGNCPRCADEDRAEDAILAYGRAVRGADKEAALGRAPAQTGSADKYDAAWISGNRKGHQEAAAAIEALEEKQRGAGCIE